MSAAWDAGSAVGGGGEWEWGHNMHAVPAEDNKGVSRYECNHEIAEY